MIVLTFEQFDELLEKAEQSILPENFHYPSRQEATELLINEENGLEDILLAYTHASDKQYWNQINDVLKEYVYLIEDTEEVSVTVTESSEKVRMSQEEVSELKKKVERLSFQCQNWYPSVDDLKEHDIGKDRMDIGFLLWLIATKLELTEDERKARKYAQKLLAARVEVS